MPHKKTRAQIQEDKWQKYLLERERLWRILTGQQEPTPEELLEIQNAGIEFPIDPTRRSLRAGTNGYKLSKPRSCPDRDKVLEEMPANLMSIGIDNNGGDYSS